MEHQSGAISPSLRSGSTLLEAARMMVSGQSSDIFVIDSDERPVGVVRQVDIVSAVSKGLQPGKVRVEDIMLQPAPSVDEEANVQEVSSVLRRSDVKRVLVRRGKEIVGVIEAGEMLDLFSSSQRNIEVFKAISVRARLRIAELLSVKPMSVDDLSEELGVKPITVRHHINILRRNGMVEEIQEESYGKVGRPLSLFRIAKSVLKKSAVELKRGF